MRPAGSLMRHFLLSPSSGRPGGGTFFPNQTGKTTPSGLHKGHGQASRQVRALFFPFQIKQFQRGVPPSSLGAIPVRIETRTKGQAARRPGHSGPGRVAPRNDQTAVRFPPHFFPHPSPGVSSAARGGVPFSSVAPGRRRRDFSKLPALCRRLVTPTPGTQSPWDAEALVLECRTRASQANTAPSLIVRRGGIPALLPMADNLEARACCPPEHFPRHRWLRASQNSRMAWPVAGDLTRREVQQ